MIDEQKRRNHLFKIVARAPNIGIVQRKFLLEFLVIVKEEIENDSGIDIDSNVPLDKDV